MTATQTLPTWASATVNATWRRQQAEALAALQSDREAGRTRSWVVMPPGSGKTLVGLETVRLLGRPALILSPNTAIQSQWVSSADLFSPSLPISTSKTFRAPITALTYQSIAVFADPDDSHGHIPRLHENGKKIVARIAEIDDLLIVLDEAHHLLATWGELVAEILDQIPNAAVLGLTGTPPERMSAREADLFASILGDVCYVASPNAVIRDGGTAPYQDLHYFVEPSALEKQAMDLDSSCVAQVTAASVSKAVGAANILEVECAARGTSMRALVLTDFETMQGKTPGVGSGSAEQVIRTFVADPVISKMHPVMVTGSRVMCDAETAGRITAWLAVNHPNNTIDTVRSSDDNVVEITGSWTSREWVPALTEWFQTQSGQVMVGTRALLGEGWDAPAVNVVIDLTASCTSVSVSQARGRGLRIDRNDPDKVASLWTVTCVETDHPEHAPDYERLVRKASKYFTAGHDAVVEGVSLLPSLKTICAEGIDRINAREIARVGSYAPALAAWKIGAGYKDKQMLYVEVAAQPQQRVALRYLGNGGATIMGDRLVMTRHRAVSNCGQNTVAKSIAAAVAVSLNRLGVIKGSYESVKVTETASGVRMWLDTTDADEAAAYQRALGECFDLSVPADAPHHPAHAVPADVYFTAPQRDLAVRPVTSYHPIPGVFRRAAEAREVFHEEWQRWVSTTRTDLAGSVYSEWVGGVVTSRRWI